MNVSQRVTRHPGPGVVAPVLLGALLLTTILSACSAPRVVSDSGKSKTLEYGFSGFTKVRLEDAFAATIIRGDTTAVSVTVDDNLVDDLRVTHDGDTLRIRLAEDFFSYRPPTQQVQITLPSLRGLKVSDGSSADVEGLDSEEPLDLSVTDGGRVDLIGVRASDVEITVADGAQLSGELEAREIGGRVSDAAHLSLEGSATAIDLDATDMCKLDLNALPVRYADLRISDVARGTVRASETISVLASDRSHLRYFGTARLHPISVSDGAQVSRVGN